MTFRTTFYKNKAMTIMSRCSIKFTLGRGNSFCILISIVLTIKAKIYFTLGSFWQIGFLSSRVNCGEFFKKEGLKNLHKSTSSRMYLHKAALSWANSFWTLLIKTLVITSNHIILLPNLVIISVIPNLILGFKVSGYILFCNPLQCSSEKSVVQRWCNSMQKPHPRYLECGFIVTPTGFTKCNHLQYQQNLLHLCIN